MPLKTAIKHLRLQPFDLSTDTGRAAERYRLALWSILAEVVSRVSGLALMVMSIKWTAPYLGHERFGVWATFVGLPALVAFLDIGVGNAMTNRVAHSLRTGGRTAARDSISSGLLILGAVSVALSAGLYGAATVIPWASVLKLGDASFEREIRQAAQVLAAASSLTLFSNGVGRVLHGLQRAYLVHVTSAVGSLLALIALDMAIGQQATMPTLIACQLIPATLMTGALVCWLWREGLISGSDAIASVKSEGPILIRSGALFCVLQLATTIGWNADSAILATAAGASSVAAFSVTARLLQMVSQPISVINAPLWAAYADALAAKDHQFIRQTFKRSILTTLTLAIAGAIVCLVIGPDVVNLWTSQSVRTTYPLLALLGAWTILECCGSALSMLLNGLNIIRQQVVTATLFIGLAIPTKIALSSHYGAEGLVSAGILSYVAALLIGYGAWFREDVRHAIHGRLEQYRS